ncbi:MAG: hypothetical protein KBC21_02420 [Candidatus Pacebacteria bacterium]|jgi:hypothetical protein|nr:hypothetical protein [Candidatus Paceibacterota bacterium]
MSIGKKSDLFFPINQAVVQAVADLYPSMSHHVQEIAGMMTFNDTKVEALLFVSTVDIVSRASNRIFDFERRSASLYLSAIHNSGMHKGQTAAMELLHDVVVEMQMAGLQFEMLQSYLKKHFGLRMQFMHSCGTDCTGEGDSSFVYQARAKEQALRTALDWSGQTRKNLPVAEVRNNYILGEFISGEAERIVELTRKVIPRNEQLLTRLA